MKEIRSLVLVSYDPASVQCGAQEIFCKLQEEIKAFGLSEEVMLATINNVEYTNNLPLVIIYPEAEVYGPVHPEDVHILVKQHLQERPIGKELPLLMHRPTGDITWLNTRQGALPAEKRIVLERAGIIDPLSLDEYIAHDGYQALKKVLNEMTADEVIAEIDKSGLRGRGGAGFPTGRKWSFVARAPGQPKYVICNADESEPGTFKDRLILEGDPFSIIEALTIAAYAVGASEGYIYIRGEYPLAYQRLDHAIQQAQARHLLGEHILGKEFSLHIHLHAGAGAYVCGEETALIESVEGKRGHPRARPPYPPTFGLWGKPTLVNNVETLANVPPILRNGAAWFHRFGMPGSTGTKVFTILGNVNATGVVEAPFGITLREIIEIYGKGMKNGAELKLAQLGGSSGSVVPAQVQDTPLDFDSLRQVGASLGSGALLICDDTTCVVDLAKVVMQFFRFESCGKCAPCRNGTQWMYEILERISAGKASPGDLDQLTKIGETVAALANCGLGQVAFVPIRDILKHFRSEVEAHVHSHYCPAGVCPVAEHMPVTQPVQHLLIGKN
jgi:NADP-reducing hydrogenase subunit HndC